MHDFVQGSKMFHPIGFFRAWLWEKVPRGAQKGRDHEKAQLDQQTLHKRVVYKVTLRPSTFRPMVFRHHIWHSVV